MPCGGYHPRVRDAECDCSQNARRTYRRRVTGPIQDRIDLWLDLDKPDRTGPDPLGPPESTATIRARVAAARRRAASRLHDTPWRVNADVPGPVLRDRWPLTPEAEARLEQTIYGGQLSRRGATRVHRVAWTLADLWAVDRPGLRELDVALALRLGRPIPLDAIHRRAGYDPLADEAIA